jgi:hypothetical protein
VPDDPELQEVGPGHHAEGMIDLLLQHPPAENAARRADDDVTDDSIGSSPRCGDDITASIAAPAVMPPRT